ncbi:MAG: glutamine--fructose-6-phosphate transaminase (isomerizing) [Rhodobacteraceae bacterium]|nr:glutamine--fructose-6-phosphate transaminase (isomerizing) [Paracoccaceae bacterium]
MCGIVGVIASTEAAPMMLEALKRLEYRGYDSAGVATLRKGVLGRRRAVGKLGALADRLTSEPISGRVGIGHTRWATHGAPTLDNAHPHMTERVAVVHNGIIENFRALRQRLEDEGVVFETETDTEVALRLCDQHLARGATPADAVYATLGELEGAFALVFLFRDHAEMLIAARRGPPLAIGYGDNEMFIGSDALALAPMTGQICYLEEGDWAIVTREGAEIYDSNRRRANREVKSIVIANAVVDKGEHRHFMAKEIHEQPTVTAYAIANYVARNRRQIQLPAEEPDFANIERLVMTACGTAYYACAVAKYWFESWARLPVDVDIASEFRYREPPLCENGASLFVSQSGETADTLAALRYCRDAGQEIMSVVNVPTSSMAREADVVFPTLAGPEIGVASTKAFTSQLITLAALAIVASRHRGQLSAEAEAALIEELGQLPAKMSRALERERRIARVAFHLSRARDILFLGRGAMYPLAMEGALKLKEVSYIHAEGHAAGELKHGPIALADENVPVVVLAPRDELFDKTISNMLEVMARGAPVVLISCAEGLKAAGSDVWHSIEMPPVSPRLAPILYGVPIQLLAYHTAVHKGTDVDQPRNLAKSVTVE